MFPTERGRCGEGKPALAVIAFSLYPSLRAPFPARLPAAFGFVWLPYVSHTGVYRFSG